MDSQQTSISSLSDRFGGGNRKEKNRDQHHKDHRLSKADIGGPISTANNKVDGTSASDSPGASSMVLRGLVIHRDDKGYGLTVSGDNPVFVQSVRENGAAQSAGVRQGDRIAKVNGTNVTEYNHIEVVKLIKSGTFVALTLLAPSSGKTESSTTTQSVGNSGLQTQSSSKSFSAMPKENSFYDQKINTIKKMLEQEKVEVERIKDEYSKDPNKKLLEELGVAQKLLQDLEKQLWKAESSKPTQDTPVHRILSNLMRRDTSSSVDEMEGAASFNMDEIDVEHNDSMEKKNSMTDITTVIDEKPSTPMNEKKMTSIEISDYDNNPGANINTGNGKMLQQQHNIMNFEEDELAEKEPMNHGPFLDFDKLKSRPAHAAVFMNYVFRSHDPSPLLFILSVEHYRQLNSSKEMVKYSEMIYRTYLTQNAPLNVSIDEGIASSIADAAQSKNLSDDGLRSVYDPAVQHVLKTVKRQLQQFCRKKEQGLGHCFGEDKLPKVMDHGQELKAVEEILAPILHDLGQIPAGLDDSEAAAMTAKSEVLEKFILQSTGKRKSKISSRFGSILRPNKPNVTVIRPKTAGSVESLLDEQNKRISILGGLGKRNAKKSKIKESSSGTASLLFNSVNAVVQPDMYIGDPGHVNQMVNKFQTSQPTDGNNSLLPNMVETDAGSDVSGNDNNGHGSFRKRKARSGTGKSNSDPDVASVEKSLLSNVSFNSHLSSSATTSSIASSGGSIAGSQSSFFLANSEDLISSLVEQHPELEVEPEYQWSLVTPKEVLKQQDKKESKRQEIINELLHTEKHHVRDLLILDLLFYKKMMSEGGLTQEELFSVFPNLQQILDTHRRLKNALVDLKTKDGYVVSTISTVLLETFGGDEGEKFKNECAKYCGNQTAALEFIKERCKKDREFSAFIQTAEKHPICRRLQLKDFVPIEFQRLTKYPLLLENIIKNTKSKEEVTRLQLVQKQCKEILSYVNKTVKDAEDYQKVVEIQKNLDSSSINKLHDSKYKNINLTERKLVHQGSLTWRITQTDKKKSIVLHCVLFEDIMVLLQRQDERYILKVHTSTSASINSTKEVKSTLQLPILELSEVIVRNVATDKRAFYVVSTEFGGQMYDLVATSVRDAKEWLKMISSTAAAATAAASKKRISMTSRRDAFIAPETSRNISKRDSSPVLEDIVLEDENVMRIALTTGNSSRSDILEKIERKNEEISAALSAKHNLLASYAGIEESELDNVLDMITEDDDADPDMMILQLLTYTEKLNAVLNDALSPDTVFLSPASQPVLLPTPDVSEGTSINAQTNIPQDLTATESDIDLIRQDSMYLSSESVSKMNTEIGDSNTSSAAEVTNDDISGQLDNASLEMFMSDYETASEPGSPSHSVTEENDKTDEETFHSENEIDQNSSVLEEKNKSDHDGDLGLLSADEEIPGVPIAADTELSDDIVAKEELDEAVDLSIESESIGKLVSPTLFDNDLLDFGVHAISPGIIVSSLSTSKNDSSLMSNSNPIDINKMLVITQHLESQLLILLRKVKINSQENVRLTSRIHEMESKSIPGSVDDGDTSIPHSESDLKSQNLDVSPSNEDVLSSR